MIGTSGLWTIVHHKHLQALSFIFNEQTRVNREKVTGDRNILILRIRYVVSFISIHVVLDEAVGIRIRVENSPGVQLMRSPVDGDLLP
jgi:hypothetical protein